jgi:hypothetical protein
LCNVSHLGATTRSPRIRRKGDILIEGKTPAASILLNGGGPQEFSMWIEVYP